MNAHGMKYQGKGDGSLLSINHVVNPWFSYIVVENEASNAVNLFLLISGIDDVIEQLKSIFGGPFIRPLVVGDAKLDALNAIFRIHSCNLVVQQQVFYCCNTKGKT